MLIDDEGYVKPASRESRLVMVQLEPRAEEEPKRSETLRKMETRTKTEHQKTRQRQQMDLFFRLMEAYCD
jgi:hypothetical protein